MWHGGIEENDDKPAADAMAQPVPRPHARLGDISSSGLRVDISEKNSIAEIIDISMIPLLLHGDYEQPGEATALS